MVLLVIQWRICTERIVRVLMLVMLTKFSTDKKFKVRYTILQTTSPLKILRPWGMEFNVKKCKVLHVGFNNTCHMQRCQMAVITATFQKSGRFKSWMAVKNSWPWVAVKWPWKAEKGWNVAVKTIFSEKFGKLDKQTSG